MRTIQIAHRSDLYIFTISVTGDVEAIEVSRGNCNRPFMDVPQYEVPDEVLNKLVDELYNS